MAEAKAYMDNYFARYQGVKRYMEAVVQSAREKGVCGNAVPPPPQYAGVEILNFNLRSFWRAGGAEYAHQGTAADIIKLAMVRVDCRLRRGAAWPGWCFRFTTN